LFFSISNILAYVLFYTTPRKYLDSQILVCIIIL
jgi:hypothetical protein